MGDSFIEIVCCEQSVGYVNGQLFTPEANQRFCAIQARLGNAWTEDVEAKALIADPASYAPPADGTPIAFGCTKCGAKFIWVSGRPMRMSPT